MPVRPDNFVTLSLANEHYRRQIHLSNPEHIVANFSTGTSTSGPRKHLVDNHLAAWVDSCDKLKIPITAKGAEETASRYRQQRDQMTPSASHPQEARPEFSHEAFVNAIIEWIVGDDQVCISPTHANVISCIDFITVMQSINVIENPQLRAIFLLLRESLTEADIPSRATLRKHIMTTLDDHLEELKQEMQESPSPTYHCKLYIYLPSLL